MSDELDLSNAVDMLKGMLSDDEGRSQIQNIVSMLGNSTQSSAPPQTENSAPDNLEMMLKLQNVMSALKSSNNSQAEFLHALSPLLKSERRQKLDKAVNILNAGKAIEVMRQL